MSAVVMNRKMDKNAIANLIGLPVVLIHPPGTYLVFRQEEEPELDEVASELEKSIYTNPESN